MTKRRRIASLDQADARLAQLDYLRFAGMPQKPVRDLMEVTAFYRGEIDRLTNNPEQGKWQQRVGK